MPLNPSMQAASLSIMSLMGHPCYILLLLALASWPAIAHPQTGERTEPLESASVAERSSSPLALSGLVRQAWADQDSALAEEYFNELAVRWPEHSETLLLSAERLDRASNLYAALQVLEHGAELHPGNPQFLYESGLLYYRLHVLEHAAEYFELSLACGFSAEAVIMLATCQASLQDIRAANDTWHRYLALYSMDDALQAGYARWLLRQDAPEEALVRWANARQLNPGVPDYYLHPAQALLEEGEIEAAVGLLAEGIRQAPSVLQYRILVAHHLSEGHPDAAISTYQDGLAQFPASDSLAAGFVNTLIEQGDQAAALEVINAAITDSSPAGFYVLKGRLEAIQGNSAQALKTYEYGLSAYPDDWQLMEAATELWGGQGDAEPVLHWMRTRRATTPKAYADLLNLAVDWLARHRHENVAQQVADRLYEDDPHDASAAYWHSELLRRGGKVDTALVEVKVALVAVGGNARLAALELDLLMQTNRTEHAVTKALALAEMPGVDENGYFVASQACIMAHQPELAIAISRNGLERHPRSKVLLTVLAGHLASQQDTAGVISLLTDPTYEATYMIGRDSTLGWAYLLEGNYVLAVAYLTLELHARRDESGELDEEGNAIVFGWLGQAQFFRGNYAEARESLTRGLAEMPGLTHSYVWLGLTLLELGDEAGARASLQAADESSIVEPRHAGWLAYGLMRLAQLDGDAEPAEKYFREAERYAQADPALSAALLEARGVL